MKSQINLLLMAAMAWWSDTAGGIAAEYKNAELDFSVTTEDSWSTADAATTTLLTQMTSQSAVAHARTKHNDAKTESVNSAILVVHSKLPLGAPGDNPNLILAKEKAWAEGFKKSGAGFLDLMQERVKLLRAPTKFVGKEKPLKIKGVNFYQMDAINTKIPEAQTKQRYICTFKDGYYVYFVLSLNDENDADYATMMKVVESFRSAQREKKQTAPK